MVTEPALPLVCETLIHESELVAVQSPFALKVSWAEPPVCERTGFVFSVAAISMEGAAGVGLGAGDGSELGELSPPQALSKNAEVANTI